MGDLLPNGNDIEIIGQLTTRFTATPFAALKHYVGTSGDDFLWNHGKSLARASYRLKIWPTSGTKARRRWFAFLKRILSRQNQIDIQDALKTAVQNAAGDIVGVQFWAQFDASVPQDTYVVRVTREPADRAGNVFLKITLLCDHEIAAGDAGDPDPGPDNGETGPVHPVVMKKKKTKKKPVKAKGKKSAVKKSARKRVVKKKR